MAERIAPHHLKKPCSVSLLDMMKQHLTGEAEVSALAHAVQMPVLRPHLEGMRQPALPIKLPMECWWPIIVIRSKESSGSQNPSDLGQGRRRFHPVQRLGSSDDISA